jgi:hypothetical protein
MLPMKTAGSSGIYCSRWAWHPYCSSATGELSNIAMPMPYDMICVHEVPMLCHQFVCISHCILYIIHNALQTSTPAASGQQ